MYFLPLASLAGFIAFAHALPVKPPTVKLDRGTFIGVANHSVEKFLGIPFAKPPVGNLRLRLPVPNDPFTGTHHATAFGLQCTQISPDPSGEDCLTLNVWRPSGLSRSKKIPVVTWIYGGGFDSGSSSLPIYDGTPIVARSMQMKEPVIFVSMNYRLSAFGLLSGKEVSEAGVGNLGLQDQRQALRWIQKYIADFNGDPKKVTIFGESAGAVSVTVQMLANGGNTEGLFRGTFMQSGGPIPIGNFSGGQKVYDEVVARTGCQDASDTLHCLREVPFGALRDAAQSLPSVYANTSFNQPFNPRADGVFLADTPQALVLKGSVSKVPFVTGDCENEATAFTLSLLNLKTEDQVRQYLKSNYLRGASSADLDRLLTLYPQDAISSLNALSPQFNRLANIQQDLLFQGPRRFFLQHRFDKQPTFSFRYNRNSGLPVVGTAHESDIFNVFSGGDLAEYLINFVNHLDPNGKGLQRWPRYNATDPQQLTFLDGIVPLTLSDDEYRKEGMELITNLTLATPL